LSATGIIISAGMVGDRDDFSVWIWRAKNWTTDLAAALKQHYGAAAIHAFQRATRAPAHHSASWQAALGNEVERLQDTVAMLSDLAAPTSQATTQWSPGAFSDDDEPVCARQPAASAAAGA
jgi:hypothetical protein